MIGCDIGTQSSKGVLVDAEGKIRASASADHRVDFPAPGHAQQDPSEWISALSQILPRLAAAAEGEITHIGIAAQLDGVVAVDSNLSPLHPALIWMDRRSTAQTEQIRNQVGPERVFEITGLNCDSSHAAPKMSWLREKIDEDIDGFLPVGTFVNAWLTGAIVQDPANASSTMLYDVNESDWSDELLEVSGFGRKALAPVQQSTQVIGRIQTGLADELGVSPQIEVVTGTGDDHASGIGAGAVRAGVIADVAGTAEPIGTTSINAVFDPGRLVETHAHALEEKWFIENPGFVSGGSIRWIAGLLDIDQSEVFRLAGAAKPGVKGMTFIPALSGAMSPRWNDYMRGSFTGISMDHGSAELCRAVIEGCTFALRDTVDRIAEMSLPVDRIHVTGGGAASDLWLQMKADVAGVPVHRVVTEGAPIGAACLAAVAAGWYSDTESASDSLVEVHPDPFEPNSAMAGVYGDAYRRYRDLFDALEPVFQP
ncbi:xylulokinase [soil metagenome]